MSRVFSLLGFCGPRLGFGGGRGPGLIVAVSKETPGLASFVAVLLFAARTRKKALSSILSFQPSHTFDKKSSHRSLLRDSFSLRVRR